MTKKHELPTIVHFTWMHICLLFTSIKKKNLILNLGAPLNSCYMILYNLELLLAAFSFAFNDVYAANSMRVYVKTYFHVYLDKPLDKLLFFY